jgi:hypothetical protein
MKHHPGHGQDERQGDARKDSADKPTHGISRLLRAGGIAALRHVPAVDMGTVSWHVQASIGEGNGWLRVSPWGRLSSVRGRDSQACPTASVAPF